MNPNETPARAADRCASEACARLAESGEIYCAECGLERSLYMRDGRSDPRVEALRETARRIFGG